MLAIGNSVGDWVADTAVAKAGQPGMGVASCFGSPLLNDVLGLSVALIVSDHHMILKSHHMTRMQNNKYHYSIKIQIC